LRTLALSKKVGVVTSSIIIVASFTSKKHCLRLLSSNVLICYSVRSDDVLDPLLSAFPNITVSVKSPIAENKILTFKQFTGAASVLATSSNVCSSPCIQVVLLFWLETTKVQLHQSVAVKVIKSDAVCPPTATLSLTVKANSKLRPTKLLPRRTKVIIQYIHCGKNLFVQSSLLGF
jgi:hypothetical protein